MWARTVTASVFVLMMAGQVWGQATGWRRPGEAVDASAVRTASATAAPATFAPRDASNPAAAALSAARPGARVTEGPATLPNQGQVWREYDISPYTLRVTATNRPEQAIVDWILRETGYEAWHSEPLGILSATPRVLRVYHTPEMQAVVADVVNRFVSSEAETYTFSLRVITVDQPNWRIRAQRYLKPVQVQTPGVGAWLIEKEDAVVVLNDLQRRSDYREHSSPHLLVNNGQSTVVSSTRAQTYARDIEMRGDVFPGFQIKSGQVDEGFSLEFNPLLSADRALIDATVKCNIDQVEKFVPVMLEVPTTVTPRQRAKIDVPQMTHFRFHERFRWPIGQSLLVGMGMVAVPVPVDNKGLVAGLSLGGPPRADLLFLVECKGKLSDTAANPNTSQRDPKTYRGRY